MTAEPGREGEESGSPAVGVMLRIVEGEAGLQRVGQDYFQTESEPVWLQWGMSDDGGR